MFATEPNKHGSAISFRGAVAAIVCSGIEFYDVTLFGIYAFAIGQTFFPNSNPQLEVLTAVAVFGAGFITRPFGSVIIGAYADRRGRRSALVLTATLMAVATLIIALMPSYGQVGILASVAVVIARLIQGFAFGGEVGPSTALVYELAPLNRRGLYASWQPAIQGLATMIAGAFGLALSASMPPGSLVDWGWRLPFLIGSAVLLIALVLRRRMPETLSAADRDDKRKIAQEMIGLVVGYPKVLVAIVTQIAFGTIAVYVCAYMNTYILTALKMPVQMSFLATCLVGIFICIGSVAGGALADVHGSRSVIYISRAILLITVYPLFWAAEGSLYGVVLLSTALPFLSMLSGGASFGAMMAALPVAVRSSGLSISYAVVVCVFGASLQFVLTLLISRTGDAFVPAYIMMVTTAVGMLGVPWLEAKNTSPVGAISSA
jgi:MFS family permease